MNPEYEALLNHIAILERQQQLEELNLSQEVLRHENSKAELRKGRTMVEEAKGLIAELHQRVPKLHSELFELKQVKAQLKAAVKQQKIDSRMLEEHALKEIAKCQSRREHYANTIQRGKAELERFQKFYKAVPGGSKAPSNDIALGEAVQKQLSDIEEEKRNLQNELLEMQQPGHPATRTEVMIKTNMSEVERCEEELARLKALVQNQKLLLEEQRAMQEATLKEFHVLDSYASSVCATFEELQRHVDSLEAADRCDCSKKPLRLEQIAANTFAQ